MRYIHSMIAIRERNFIFNKAGQPQCVIIPWNDYLEIAETLGWDLSQSEAAELREAMNDSSNGNREAFVAIEDLEK